MARILARSRDACGLAGFSSAALLRRVPKCEPLRVVRLDNTRTVGVGRIPAGPSGEVPRRRCE